MNTLYVLNIANVRNAIKDCIDRPSTLSEVLNQNYQNCDKANDTWILQGILDKLSRHEDDFRGQTPSKHLFNLVKDVATSLREDISDAGNLNKVPFSEFFHIFDKRRLHTVETIGTSTYRYLEKKTNNLRGLISDHQKLIITMQKAQQACLTGKSKVNKYKLMLETARVSREQVKAQLSKKGLKVRDDVIKGLEKTLKTKENNYDSATMAYCKLRCQVEATARHMKQIDDKIRTKIMSEVLDRVKENLTKLTYLSKTYSSLDSRKVLLEEVEAIDLRAIVKSVLSRGQTVYRYPDPCEYTRIYGFDKHIPTPKLYQRTERQTLTSAKYHECLKSLFD